MLALLSISRTFYSYEYPCTWMSFLTTVQPPLPFWSVIHGKHICCSPLILLVWFDSLAAATIVGQLATCIILSHVVGSLSLLISGICYISYGLTRISKRPMLFICESHCIDMYIQLLKDLLLVLELSYLWWIL